MQKTQSVNLFEIFGGEQMFNVKEDQSPSIPLRVIESK